MSLFQIKPYVAQNHLFQKLNIDCGVVIVSDKHSTHQGAHRGSQQTSHREKAMKKGFKATGLYILSVNIAFIAAKTLYCHIKANMHGSFISVVQIQRQGWLVITDTASITVPLMVTF